MPRRRASYSFGITCGWLLLLCLWMRFWWLDLRFSQAASLLLLPIIVGTTAAAAMAGLGHEWRRAFRLGAALGVLPVWAYFWTRASHVGCVGVSESYSDALGGTLILFLLLAFDFVARPPESHPWYEH